MCVTERGFDDVSAANPTAVVPDADVDRQSPDGDVFESSPIVFHLDPVGTDGLSICSFFAGIFGLATAFVLAGMAYATGCQCVAYWLRTTLVFSQLIIVIQAFVLPGAVISGVIIAATMMWYPALILRTMVAGASLLLGVGAYQVSRSMMRWPFYQFEPFEAICLAYFVCGSGLALAAQFIVNHRVAPIRMSEVSPPKLSLRYMLELTCIAALFAWLLAYYQVALVSTVACMAGFSLLTTSLGLTTLAFFLRRRLDQYWLIGVMTFLCFVISLCVVVTNFAMSFSANAIASNVPRLVGYSLWGTIIALSLATMSGLWLRICGWRWVG